MIFNKILFPFGDLIWAAGLEEAASRISHPAGCIPSSGDARSQFPGNHSSWGRSTLNVWEPCPRLWHGSSWDYGLSASPCAGTSIPCDDLLFSSCRSSWNSLPCPDSSCRFVFTFNTKLRNCLNFFRKNYYSISFKAFKDLFGCFPFRQSPCIRHSPRIGLCPHFGRFRQVSAVETERFLLSQLAKTSQKSSQNPLKIN